jgi:carbon storage regulator
MLVLSRRPGERILIGDQICITILRTAGGSVRVGIDAPSNIPILRDELQAVAEPATAPHGSAHAGAQEMLR